MRITRPRKSFYIRRYWLCSGGFEEFAIRASHDPTEFVLESVIFEH
jgi:hypothetical protein